MQSVGPDSKQSWVVATACFVIQIMSFGLIEVSGLFFVATVPRYKTKRELASLPYTMTYCVRSALGPLIGYLGCRFGIRQVTLIGCIISTIAVGACFFVDDIIPLIILWGVLFGFSLGLETSLLNVILNEHFVKNRVKANGLNAAGASIGNMLLSPIITYLIEDAYGLSGTFLVISGFMLNSIPAAIIIMLNKPKSLGGIANAYTSDIESVLKIRTSVVPAIDVKMERRFSNSDTQNKAPQSSVQDNRTKDYNTENGYDCMKPSLVLIQSVQRNGLSDGQNLSYPFSNEINVCSENGGEMCIVTDTQVSNDSFSNESDKMHSILLIKSRSSSLILNPNQLHVIPENENKPNVLTDNIGTSSESQNEESMYRNTTLRDDGLLEQHKCKTLVNGRSLELRNNEISIKLNRDGNQNTITSFSELTITSWENGGPHFHNLLEEDCTSSEKPTNKFPTHIANNKVTEENGKTVLNPTCDSADKSVDKSKWQIYRLACEPVYLLLLVGSAIYYFSVTTFLTIIVDYATDIGLSITYSTYILTWVGFWDIIAYAVLGYIIERGYFTQSKFACLGYLGMCLTSAAMVWAPSYIVLLFILTLFEFSQAGVIILAAPLVAELIDPDLQATAIASVTLLSAPVSLGISPLIGYFRDGSGSYSGLFYVISASSLLCCLLFLCIPRVRRR